MPDLTLSFSPSTDWSHMTHDEQQRALFKKQKDLKGCRQFDDGCVRMTYVPKK